MTALDRDNDEKRLYEASKAAIASFGERHASAECSQFAFDADPHNGILCIAFDTPEHSKTSILQIQEFAIQRREKSLQEPDAWKNARYYLNSPMISMSAEDSSFAFPDFDVLRFPEWERYFVSPDYQAGDDPRDDYLSGYVRILAWKTMEKLFSENAFDPLRRTRPFILSYGLHDQESCILRITNWQ